MTKEQLIEKINKCYYYFDNTNYSGSVNYRKLKLFDRQMNFIEEISMKYEEFQEVYYELKKKREII